MPKIWDKVIDVTFSRMGIPFDVIETPESGIKPNISCVGTFLAGTSGGNCMLKLVNYYPQKKISMYQGADVKVSMGYRKSIKRFVFSGRVFFAFVESPNPDGVTVFNIDVGGLQESINAEIEIKDEKSLDVILNLIKAELLKKGLKVSVVNTATTRASLAGVEYNGSVNGLLNVLREYFDGVKVMLYSGTLYAFDEDKGLKLMPVTKLDYFLSPPIKNGNGITVDVCMQEGVAPGRLISVPDGVGTGDFAANLRASASFMNKMMVQSCSFGFATVENVNYIQAQAVGV